MDIGYDSFDDDVGRASVPQVRVCMCACPRLVCIFVRVTISNDKLHPLPAFVFVCVCCH